MSRALIIVEKVAPLGSGNGKEHLNSTLISTYVALGYDVNVIVTKQDSENIFGIVSNLGAKLLKKSKLSSCPNLSLKLYLAALTYAHSVEKKSGTTWLNSAISNTNKNGVYDIAIASLLGSDMPAWVICSLKYLKATKAVVLWEHRSHYAEKSDFSRVPQIAFFRRNMIYYYADLIAVVSRPLAKLIKQKLKNVDTKLIVVPNPVKDVFINKTNSKEFIDICSRPYCLCTQNFVRPLKGINFLIEAMNIISKYRDDIHLLLVGNHNQNVLNNIKESKAYHMITIIGQVPHTEIPKYVANARLAVVPSLIETFSVPAAEALTAGKPVVSTICGGPEDFIINNKHGKLVPPGDSQKLAQAIVEVWDSIDDFDQNELSSYAKKRFGGEEWPEYWKRCHKLLQIS